MGLTDEQIDSVIDAHTETVDALKKERDDYKTEAGKLTDVQKELDTLKSGKDWKAEHDKLKQQFDDYKADIQTKENAQKVRAAYRKLLDDQKIAKEDADLIMSATQFGDMKLNDDGALEGADKLTENIKTNYARYIPTVETKGAKVDTPPKNDAGTGANPRAAEIARQFYERRYGKAPESGAKDNT